MEALTGWHIIGVSYMSGAESKLTVVCVSVCVRVLQLTMFRICHTVFRKKAVFLGNDLLSIANTH